MKVRRVRPIGATTAPRKFRLHGPHLRTAPHSMHVGWAGVPSLLCHKARGALERSVSFGESLRTRTAKPTWATGDNLGRSPRCARNAHASCGATSVPCPGRPPGFPHDPEACKKKRTTNLACAARTRVSVPIPRNLQPFDSTDCVTNTQSMTNLELQPSVFNARLAPATTATCGATTRQLRLATRQHVGSRHLLWCTIRANSWTTYETAQPSAIRHDNIMQGASRHGPSVNTGLALRTT